MIQHIELNFRKPETYEWLFYQYRRKPTNVKSDSTNQKTRSQLEFSCDNEGALVRHQPVKVATFLGLVHSYTLFLLNIASAVRHIYFKNIYQKWFYNWPKYFHDTYYHRYIHQKRTLSEALIIQTKYAPPNTVLDSHSNLT